MLETKYNHKLVEDGKYEFWLKNKCFQAGDKSKEPFSIVIPPPNVTGVLHLGHAWNTTLQDIIIRYKKMNGYDTLWVPGMDHAGIATQAKVDAKLKAEGINPRQMDREEWLNKAWEWKKIYAENIHKQWATLGLSLDYSRERFTLDEGLNKAVTEVFVKYYNEGIIYRGERIINWDPEAQTALSNEEVIYKDIKGAFYHIKYFIENTKDYIEIATTRPETLFGDTAVAVNPEDERYKTLIGKNVVLPIVNKLIPIIGDIHADPSFGTGAVKITPAHDPNDFEVGNRHNLERILCINTDGTMNKNAGVFEGLDRFECREKLIEELKKQDLLVSIENISHNVGHSERTNVMVEPYLSKQWFVDMKKLSLQVLKNQKEKDKKVNFIPARFEKILSHWMEDCHDWCVSRQLWWGHRIPAWYKGDKVYVGLKEPQEEGWVQDSDVLDTWFSSALWPFSTLSWPNETEDLKRYYPNSLLVTAYDIIFFWVARMIFQGIELTQSSPFKDCLIHGLIRDKEGRKMSKSLDNGVDPIEVIDKYGADSLRFFLSTSSAPGQDLRYDEDKVASSWNFINKLWNASRFVLINLESFDMKNFSLDNLSIEDKWILTKLNKTILDVKSNMDKYLLHNAGNKIYEFTWNIFCDWYIEISKNNMDNNTTKSVLLTVLSSILKMLHPFIPFVTEEIYSLLPNKLDTIMNEKYPVYDKNFVFKDEEKIIDETLEEITNIRNFKKDNNIPKESKIIIECDNQIKSIVNNLLKVKEINLEGELKELNYISKIINVRFKFINNENNEEIIKELLNQKELLELSIKKRENLLSNVNYVNKAPQNIVEEEHNKLKSEREKLQIILNQIK